MGLPDYANFLNIGFYFSVCLKNKIKISFKLGNILGYIKDS